MKKCPFCAEDIQEEAIKCRHCGEFLDGRTPVAPREEVPKVPWYGRTSTLVAVFVCAGPLVLPLVWLHPRFSPTKKIVISMLVLVATYFLFAGLVNAFKTLDEYSNLLQGIY